MHNCIIFNARIGAKKLTSNAKTADQVRRDFRHNGIKIKDFAVQKGFKPIQVYRVLNGTIKAVRGKGHEIAVALGMKVPE